MHKHNRRSHRPTRRQLLGLAASAAGGLLLRPTQLAASRAAPLGVVAPCDEPTAALLDAAATVEALSVTFYYSAVTGAFFDRLSGQYQRWLRASLDQEQAHLDLLLALGAQAPQVRFRLGGALFGFDSFARFLEAQAEVEGATISMYSAATGRAAAQGQAQLAALFGQIGSVEAEQRVLGREMSQLPPNPRNDLCLERASLSCAELVRAALGAYLADGTTALPTPSAVLAAVGADRCTDVARAAGPGCNDTIAALLDVAALAEAVGIAFYYSGVRGGIFGALPQPQQWYLQAALDEERTHLALLRTQGAAAPRGPFYVRPGTFASLPLFLVQLDDLENLFIGAYLATSAQLATLGQPLLAQIAGQIGGVEAEHRALGRLMAGSALPSERRIARAPYRCLGEVRAALEPLLAGNETYNEQAQLPDDAAITAAVGAFGCAPVAPARARAQLFLPLISTP